MDFGWSMFSTYIDVDDSIQNVMASVVNSIEIVKDGEGKVYWPSNGVNLIHLMQKEKGYQVKMNTAETLSLDDYAIIPELTPILLAM